ncbi:prepilin-type N-terminal cleavage/methylation domain-containing protein, partial [Aliarcobacter butzleri]|uniref:prepilin-type N-terminal cleavage/methylation domain-containing protein n=1 Tax=Aliarcobacter butzleri TaxID=28197 RepID=UPI0012610479
MKLKKSFTLVELLISIGIIGILVGVGIPIYNDYKKEAIKRVVDSNLTNIKKLIKTFIITTPLNRESRIFNLYGVDSEYANFRLEIKKFKNLEYFNFSEHEVGGISSVVVLEIKKHLLYCAYTWSNE